MKLLMRFSMEDLYFVLYTFHVILKPSPNVKRGIGHISITRERSLNYFILFKHAFEDIMACVVM